LKHGGRRPRPHRHVESIDQGWSLNGFDPYGYYYGCYGKSLVTYFQGKDGHFTVDVSIDPKYRSLFGVSKPDGTGEVGVTIVTDPDSSWPCYAKDGRLTGSSLSAHSSTARNQTPTTDIPTTTTPDPASLPDLEVLPASDIGIQQRKGWQFLTFGATVWNDGPSPMTVEEYHRPDSDIMNAYQYFYEDQQVVGRARVGTMKYDPRPGHQHWHFRDFAQYSLLDSTGQRVVLSTKVLPVPAGSVLRHHEPAQRPASHPGPGQPVRQPLRARLDQQHGRPQGLDPRRGHRSSRGRAPWHGIDSGGCYYYCY
jgi:hypothetical protein